MELQPNPGLSNLSWQQKRKRRPRSLWGRLPALIHPPAEKEVEKKRQHVVAAVTSLEVIDQEVSSDPRHCLLSEYNHTARHKVTNQFQELALLLAKREIAMTWKAARGPQK
ncbi:hypothetical protein NDU88_001772 [Pleurodeles waltl]|uniref:Uncharacterized protein n=1 Tax=Pleurodeles waltl TaxID=8319 RepID=A0AAV7T192_PLEWA|nr:hypothetical protein NDU88_001772 [Pleurodeles waltl]